MLKKFTDFTTNLNKITHPLKEGASIPSYLYESESYKAGCLMSFFDNDTWSDITSVIDKADLHEKGIEIEPHVTILYGFADTIDLDNLLTKVRGFPNITVDLQSISVFENDAFDVVKFDIINDSLTELNDIVKEYEHENEYPVYHPHMTIAYVKKGMGQKYIQNLDLPIKLTSTYYIYSLSNGNKIKIDI